MAQDLPGEICSHAITKLATMITKWTTSCDSALLRLARYVHGTVDWVLVGYVGESPAYLLLRLFPDADFAGDRPSYNSTSGALLCLHGPATYMPIAARSKKQTSVSHSTPEAEIVSLDFGVRTLALPALDLRETVFNRDIDLEVLEDNEAAIQILKTGRNPSLRHVSRVQGVSIASAHEIIQHPRRKLIYQWTGGQRADILTKIFKDKVGWEAARANAGISRPLKPSPLKTSMFSGTR